LANNLTGLSALEYLSRSNGTTTRSFLTDTRGSTIALTNSSGAVVTEHTYEPFGKLTITGETGFSSFGFAGREHDADLLFAGGLRFFIPPANPGMSVPMNQTPPQFLAPANWPIEDGAGGGGNGGGRKEKPKPTGKGASRGGRGASGSW
jgi:hypothetical protein